MNRVPLLLSALCLTLSTAFAGRVGFDRQGPNGGSVEGEGVRYGRYSSGSVQAEGPNGGTYDASGTRVGRFGTGSVNAQGPNGGSYNASGTRVGGYSQGSVKATGPNGGSYNAAWSGYRTGYVYRNGGYYQADIVVSRPYVAPFGVYAGWTVVTQPYYVAYPAYATLPVEVAVQVQLQRRGYYRGAIDGYIGPVTGAAISQFQAQNGLKITGTITKGLLKALNII